MNLLLLLFMFLFGVCDAGYGASYSDQELSDVEAPAYVPSYLKNQNFAKTGPTKSYHGTKTGYSGTKTSFAKTGYTSTKSGYHGTKTSSYTGSKSWSSQRGLPATYEEFYKNANQPYQPVCDPECKNSGICVAPNTCHCPANYHGTFCEFEKKPCLAFPPAPNNSVRKCSGDFCTITCNKGYKFFDGTTVANMRCQDGQWQPTRADLTSLTDCMPECQPPCLNGGICLGVNTCRCPDDYRGPQCQYSTSACHESKLGFNGGYKCFGDAEQFSCSLICPPGADFSSPPSALYTCLYSTGQFSPQPIPHCEFYEVVIIAPNSYHSSGSNHSYYEFNNHTIISGHSETKNLINYEVDGISHSSSSSLSQTKNNQVQIVVQDLTPKGGTCLTWAGAHYKTFDGKIYSFLSPCQYILVRDTKDHKFTVVIKHGECKRNYYCPSELHIFVEDKEYVLSVGEDGAVLFRSGRRLLPVPARLPGISVTQGAYVSVELGAATVLWDTNNVVSIEASVLLWNNTEGLCGSLDGTSENDFKTRDGPLAKTKSTFVASWQVNQIGDSCDSSPSEVNSCLSQTDDDMKKAQQFCTSVFNKEKFRKCANVMDVSMLMETCQWDYCACMMSLSPEECACNTVAVYAKECLRHGVEEMRMWRDADTCPMHCPDGKIYQSCGPETQPSCVVPSTPARADNSSCVEGCFCPEGLLLEAGRCIPKNECPCRLRNKTFKPGSSVKKECNTCTCEAGEWSCTKAACGARCSAVGDPHYATFDGRRFDFMGHCTYQLLQTDDLTIEVENIACLGTITEAMNLTPYKGAGKPSCTKAVSLTYDGASVHLKQGGLILVNGKEVSTLPVHVGKILIRAASSLFVIVQLPNGVEVWWDGNTRVFVDVPPELQGKTKGLCGTFNLNQKDDFLTPEGDIEQNTLSFANKWKTREFCSDVEAVEPEHPCKANVQNKAAAEKYCSKLKSSLFEPCHWHVDVQPFYEACVYDMCACAGDVSRCLCPVLGDYAMACAKNGLNIQWRYNVKECELSCPGGQEYTVCADSCLRTCSDVALATTMKCKPTCVEGCACLNGQVLDATSSCVPVGLCPCFHKGMEFKPGYKEVRAGRRERELCTCIGAKWDCKPATPSDIQNYPPAEDILHNCSAALNMEFTTCVTVEPLTCKNMHLPPTSVSAECRPGCHCKQGYVLDAGTSRCVRPTDCPCHHAARSYPDLHVMQQDCNTCVCKSGNWSCTELRCAGSCAAWGDAHVETFDGAQFEFEGVCGYVLAKGCLAAGELGFEVQIQNEACGTTGATCSKSVTLKVGSDAADDEVVALTKGAPLPQVNQLKKIKLREAGAYVFLDVPALGFTLQWDRGLRVYIKLDVMWQNRVKGLCGNYNSDSRDDFQTPSSGGLAESSALIFADSWRVKTTCPKASEVKDHCEQRPERKQWASATCSVLKRAPFSRCHGEVPPGAHVERCERDACACDAGDDCGCACAALAHYAQRCAERGVPLSWRTPDLCPMQCDEECSNYNACISPCPIETCDNTLNYDEIKTSCSKDSCVEGCKRKNSCPEGSVYSNSSLSECVPRARCRPVCTTLPDGRTLLEGELLSEDACHACRCSQGQTVCVGQPCPTELPTTTDSSPKPQDEPLKCVSGWTEWVNNHSPESSGGESIESEPVPSPKDFAIGSPMCKKDKMTQIECRTVEDHKSSKETGLDVECSFERGLLCKETGKLCPDFEIRVHCDCGEEPFQCMDSTHPAHVHPACDKFYECTPASDGAAPHAVVKQCGEGLMFNPNSMVCDWPAAVLPLRPECGNDTKETRTFESTVTITTATWATVTTPTTPELTTARCPEGQVYSECAVPCDKLCDHYKKSLLKKEKCKFGQKCIEGCIDESVANIKCDFGSMWRDEKTCVPIKDCTCMSNDGKLVKPGGVTLDDCVKCQCLDNGLHCDTNECISVFSAPAGPTHQPMLSPEAIVTPPPILLVKSTVSPPPECTGGRYKNLLWDWEPLPDSAFTASSMINGLFSPQNAILNGHAMDITAGSWAPAQQDENQFIQVELSKREPIYGIIMQGSPLFDQYVTSYEVLYSDDGHIFTAIQGPDGANKVFRGPTDNDNALKQMFSPPIEAKFVRVHPLTWHEEIAIRFELIGCSEEEPTTVTTTTEEIPITTLPSTTPLQTTVLETTPLALECTDLLGLSAGLAVDNIEVSSNTEKRQNLDLNSERGWRPLYSTPGEWIMFDFTEPRNITGIKTKGGPNGWVTSYNVMYTSNLTTFNPVVDSTGSLHSFPANFDKETAVLNQFHRPIRARYLKVLPMKWHDNIEMRIEPVGCFKPYPELATTVASTHIPTTESACLACPGAPTDVCPCSGVNLFYDGENCVSRDQCPCFVGFMSYTVGSTFRGTQCDECLCKLGGVTQCNPAAECTCEADLVPKMLSDTCECKCETCTNGTKICPTSKMCLALDKWCDGLQDCPDDERDCATTTHATTTTTHAPTTTTHVTTVEPTIVTTVAPTVAAVITTKAPKLECPKVECPSGYEVHYTRSAPTFSRYSNSDLPPPRPRVSYQKYYKGGSSKGGKGGYSKGSKGGYSKGGYMKGGYARPPAPPKANAAFTLDKPAVAPEPTAQVCAQFRCVPRLPQYSPGVPAIARVCSAPACPHDYTLKMEEAIKDECPQYTCVPPPERPIFCNITGRTVNTFDGSEYKYDMCFHILAREAEHDAWVVLVRKKCRVDGCSNELLVRQDDQLILVKRSLMIEYENFEYTVEQTSMICFQKNSFDLHKLGNGLMIKSRKYNFTVLYNTDGDIKIGVAQTYSGSVDGMCGFFDGRADNDRRLPNGRPAYSLDVFGRAWAKPDLPPDACRTKAISAEKQKKAWELCDIITKEPLSQCAEVLDLHKWRSICLEKLCECAELVVNGTRLGEKECRCMLLEQLVSECLAASRDVPLDHWRVQADCPAECPAPLVHHDCYRLSCEPTCGGTNAGPCDASDGQCATGCFCPAGTLRRGRHCLLPAQCRDCSCSAAGNKYTTFERDDMPVGGHCTYLASRDRNQTHHHNYQVFVTNGPCENNGQITCTKMVHLISKNNVIRIEQGPDTKKLQVTINGTMVFKYPLKKDWIEVTFNGQDINILLPESYVEVIVTHDPMELEVRVPSHVYANATEGLCGVCAGYEEHLVTADGNITENLDVYGKSWQANGDTLTTLGVPPNEKCGDELEKKEECVAPPPEENPCYALYDVDKYGACHALVDPLPFIEACTLERCEGGGTGCVGAHYVAECRRLGICLTACPKPCKSPFVYRPCVTCEPTCFNYEELKDLGNCDKPPIEGCVCPEGKVRMNNTCIEPEKCFPCDADNQHFAGDEWQEDACKSCSCLKASGEQARVVCTSQSCTEPACADDQDMVRRPAPPGACCPQYLCVPKPKDSPVCEEPKQIECGHGQVLKQKGKPNGCTEFACECKPPSECEPLPSEAPPMPGIERVVDNEGCCPRVVLRCRPETCLPHVCPPHFHAVVHNGSECCPIYTCEPPKDKCIVSLEWEASPKGGEVARASPEILLKELESSWTDGPCRSCSCVVGALGPTVTCAVLSCPPPAPNPLVVLRPRPEPYTCCAAHEQVACRDGDHVYQVGEKWPSPTDKCETFECVRAEDGSLQRATTRQTCDTTCQLGWEYAPSDAACCGACRAVGCVVAGAVRPAGATWRSADNCVRYECQQQHEQFQVHGTNESCPEVSQELKKQFVLEEETVNGSCCKKQKTVACRVGNLIYQEGQTWQTNNPCVNTTCARDDKGDLTFVEVVQTCDRECQPGWAYREGNGTCCGRCEQIQCLVDGVLMDEGSSQPSEDNCTWVSCSRSGQQLLTAVSRASCPDVRSCPPDRLYREGCCQRCRELPMNLSPETCKPESLPESESVGVVRVRGSSGLCTNVEPLPQLKECRGTCYSGTLYYNATGRHSSRCECCQATAYAPLVVTLHCEDGSTRPHQVSSPTHCGCRNCGSISGYPTETGTNHPTKQQEDLEDFFIPEIYQRFGSTRPPR